MESKSFLFALLKITTGSLILLAITEFLGRTQYPIYTNIIEGLTFYGSWALIFLYIVIRDNTSKNEEYWKRIGESAR